MKNDFFSPFLENLTPKQKINSLKKNCILAKNALYFDWTASGLGLKLVEKRISKLLPFYANTHSDNSPHSKLISDIYEGSRENLKQIFGLDENYSLISCGFGSSAAIKKFQEIMGIYIPPKAKQYLTIKKENLPLVIIGPYEHHSNELSFKEGLCEVKRIPLTKDGLIDLEVLKQVLEENKGRKIIASFSLCSNVSGILAPFWEISYLVRKYGGIVCFDMASSSSYFNIPAEFYDVAFLSPHKLLGGIGSSGILIIRKELIDKTLPPTFCGGGVVGYVSRTSQIYHSNEEIREEAGTPGILQFLRANLAYRIKEEVGEGLILEKKSKLAKPLREFLQNEPKITLYGNQAHNALEIFSFNIQNHSPYDVAKFLGEKGILVRAGCACAGPYGHDLLGLEDNAVFKEKPGWIRVSVHYTHTKEEITHLCECLKAFLV
ncbi:aminotransferase class V-fold PLP-dependent enzyme [Helicobacter burdigaliensis]|uniref:aminotransferase class V-fold PLP-dependent enzyme n=1 Tax=Helicobacter burdigaliensis TaxID=2315334 RepID=UPI000EF6BEB1|nr:aminotransferase class V-fold PLP-dependent enzyme [Helicobacter burdigaliensis]